MYELNKYYCNYLYVYLSCGYNGVCLFLLNVLFDFYLRNLNNNKFLSLLFYEFF